MSQNDQNGYQVDQHLEANLPISKNIIDSHLGAANVQEAIATGQKDSEEGQCEEIQSKEIQNFQSKLIPKSVGNSSSQSIDKLVSSSNFSFGVTNTIPLKEEKSRDSIRNKIDRIQASNDKVKEGGSEIQVHKKQLKYHMT